MKKAVLKNFANSHESYRPATLLKTDPNIDVFLWIFLRAPILKNIC